MNLTRERDFDNRGLLLASLNAVLSATDLTGVVAKRAKDQDITNQEYTDPEIECGLARFEIGNENIYFDRLLNFNKTMIKKLFHHNYTLEELETSLQVLIKILYPKKLSLSMFLKSIDNNPERVSYFTKRGLLYQDARACALALSFYTGHPTKSNIRGFLKKRMNRNGRFNRLAKKDETSSHYLVIVHFLFKALSHIPTYSGLCIRAVDLTDQEKGMYDPYSIIDWPNFSSSSKGDEPAASFSGKNTYFYIQSLNGKFIADFSNFRDENEILFHPCSTFLVVKKYERGGKTHIYLRQIELGMSNHTVLWLDDKIFDKDLEWEHKSLYDKLCGQAYQYGIRIIPKTSLAQVQSFLASPFGKFSMGNSQNFQVITSKIFAEWLIAKKYNFEGAILGSDANEEKSRNFVNFKDSSEVESYLQNKFRIQDQLWNCSINEEKIYNLKIQENYLSGKRESEDQTPRGDIFISATPESEASNHQTLMDENQTLTAMDENPTPGNSINNTSRTPAGIDSLAHTPGLVDCSQEAARLLLIEKDAQQKQQTGSYDFNSNNRNFSS